MSEPTPIADPDISEQWPHILAWLHLKPVVTGSAESVASPTSAIPPAPGPDDLTPEALEGLARYEDARKDPNHHLTRWCSEACCRRYMIANKGNAKKAFIAMLNTMRWRCVDLPKHVDPAGKHAERYRRCMTTRYVEWTSQLDPQGRPCIWITSRFADLEIPESERLDYVVACMEEGVRRIEESAALSGKNVTQWNVLVDETDKRWKHVDNGFLRIAVPVVFNHYVERLHKLVIVNGGMFTGAAIAVGKLFIDSRTAAKLMTDDSVDEDSGRKPPAELTKIVGINVIPKTLGGGYEFVPLETAIAAFAPWHGGLRVKGATPPPSAVGTPASAVSAPASATPRPEA